MIRRFLASLTTVIAVSFLMVPLASAHVVVTPDSAETATRVTFSVSVPNEKDVAVTGLKLTIPAGLKDVTPTVHPGWTIQTTKANDTVTAIQWTGGEIPTGQRDDFTLRAQTPEKTGDLQWKAYQSYADGTTVAWDQAPTEEGSESETSGPYSVTKVSDEAAPVSTVTQEETTSGTSRIALLLSLVALVLGIIALQRNRKQK